MRNSHKQTTRPLLKTHNRDLIFIKSENYNLLKRLVELKARQQPPIHVPTAQETGLIYGTKYQPIPNSNLSGMIEGNDSVSWGRRGGEESLRSFDTARWSYTLSPQYQYRRSCATIK